MNAKIILEILEDLVVQQIKRSERELDEATFNRSVNWQDRKVRILICVAELKLWRQNLEFIEKQQKEEEQIQHCRMSLG